MHTGQYVFAQITLFLPQRQFRRIVSKYRDRTEGWGFSHWSHMLVLMFGQLIGCGSLREHYSVIHFNSAVLTAF